MTSDYGTILTKTSRSPEVTKFVQMDLCQSKGSCYENGCLHIRIGDDASMDRNCGYDVMVVRRKYAKFRFI